jgi:hypothetical protein
LKNGGSMTEYAHCVCHSSAFPLNQARLERVMSGLRSGSCPPIRVKRCGDRYDIMDGRHRVAGSILLGYSSIEAN